MSRHITVSSEHILGPSELVADTASGAVIPGPQLKVLDPVVGLDPVAVVDRLSGQQCSSESTFHDQSMFFELAAAHAENPVAVGVDISESGVLGVWLSQLPVQPPPLVVHRTPALRSRGLRAALHGALSAVIVGRSSGGVHADAMPRARSVKQAQVGPSRRRSAVHDLTHARINRTYRPCLARPLPAEVVHIAEAMAPTEPRASFHNALRSREIAPAELVRRSRIAGVPVPLVVHRAKTLRVNRSSANITDTSSHSAVIITQTRRDALVIRHIRDVIDHQQAIMEALARIEHLGDVIEAEEESC